MSPDTVVPLDAVLALEAARLGPAIALPCANRIIYATLLHHGAELWTHDAHFRELPGVRFIAAPPPAAD
jgi:predicted nucleic acid-binding protein